MVVTIFDKVFRCRDSLIIIMPLRPFLPPRPSWLLCPSRSSSSSGHRAHRVESRQEEGNRTSWWWPWSRSCCGTCQTSFGSKTGEKSVMKLFIEFPNNCHLIFSCGHSVHEQVLLLEGVWVQGDLVVVIVAVAETCSNIAPNRYRKG